MKLLTLPLLINTVSSRDGHWRAVRLCIFAASALVIGAAAAAPVDAKGDIRVQDAHATRPQLIFACDRQTSELESLFTPPLIADLKELHAAVALSLEDLSPARAQMVRQLNAAGIPMMAWIVLPKDQGYYVNASNAPQTAARFEAFDKWTTDHGLRWDEIGLDIEPTLNEYATLTGHKGKLLSLALRRAFDSGRVYDARKAYAALVQKMQSRGYRVQTHQLVFIVDERNAHTTLLERLFGLVDVRGDREVLMLYTNFARNLGAALIWQYGPAAQTIAVGSTAASGDAAADAKNPPLNWEEFSRDLIVAHHFSPVIGVYSLEGCVRQGFMPKLKMMDWTQAVVIPAESIEQSVQYSNGVHTVLWLGAHSPYFITAFLVVAAWLVRALVRWRRRRRSVKPLE